MPTLKKDLAKLTKLGHSAKAGKTLEVFPNHAPKANLSVTLECTEFTCLCPLTKQPDFGTIEITYIPDFHIVESKSMKLYLETYRNQGVFHEHLVIDITKDFIKFVQPLAVTVEVKFNSRGGIAISAKHTWEKQD